MFCGPTCIVAHSTCSDLLYLFKKISPKLSTFSVAFRINLLNPKDWQPRWSFGANNSLSDCLVIYLQISWSQTKLTVSRESRLIAAKREESPDQDSSPKPTETMLCIEMQNILDWDFYAISSFLVVLRKQLVYILFPPTSIYFIQQAKYQESPKNECKKVNAYFAGAAHRGIRKFKWSTPMQYSLLLNISKQG